MRYSTTVLYLHIQLLLVASVK